jgi:hypothetical protein
MIEDDDSVFAAMKAGARSYLLKGARRAEITRAITAVGNGEAIFGAAIAARLIGYFSVPRQPRGADAFPELTPRQVEILARMARHESNPDIARRLSISEKTVRKQRVRHPHQAVRAGQSRGDRRRPRRKPRPAAPVRNLIAPGRRRDSADERGLSAVSGWQAGNATDFPS